MRYTNQLMEQQAGMGSVYLGTTGKRNSFGIDDVKQDQRFGAAKALAAKAATARYAETLIARAAVRNDVRLMLVAELRDAIAAGTYRVSAADLAEKMMATMVR